MRVTKLFTVSVAASLLLGTVAHASDSPGVAEGSVRRSEVVTRTGLPWNVETFQRVSPTGAQYYSGLHWTSAIGTGTAAALERGDDSFQQASPAKAQHTEPVWTSMIGTGTAAALER
ncbi:MAG: hypothetical protein JWM63_4935 [Gammaproteobacteria bacterium]|jgi:hypothetical protein|nr:hypothetical protein [Gammaproteobacteria bacterium]